MCGSGAQTSSAPVRAPAAPPPNWEMPAVPTGDVVEGEKMERSMVCPHLCFFAVSVLENLADFTEVKIRSTQG